MYLKHVFFILFAANTWYFK